MSRWILEKLSGLALIALLVGGFSMAMGYQMVFDACLGKGFAWNLCWEFTSSEAGLRQTGVGLFYAGVLASAIGGALLIIYEGGSILGKLRKRE